MIFFYCCCLIVMSSLRLLLAASFFMKFLWYFLITFEESLLCDTQPSGKSISVKQTAKRKLVLEQLVLGHFFHFFLRVVVIVILVWIFWLFKVHCCNKAIFDQISIVQPQILLEGRLHSILLSISTFSFACQFFIIFFNSRTFFKCINWLTTEQFNSLTNY